MGNYWASLPHGMTVALFGPAGSVLQCSFSFFTSAKAELGLEVAEKPIWEQEFQFTGTICKPGCTKAAEGYSEASVQPPLLILRCWSEGSAEPF